MNLEAAGAVTWRPTGRTALVINVIAVVWLLWSKRLFGLNGGATAYWAEHHTESLMSVERAGLEGASR